MDVSLILCIALGWIIGWVIGGVSYDIVMRAIQRHRRKKTIKKCVKAVQDFSKTEAGKKFAALIKEAAEAADVGAQNDIDDAITRLEKFKAMNGSVKK